MYCTVPSSRPHHPGEKKCQYRTSNLDIIHRASFWGEEEVIVVLLHKIHTVLCSNKVMLRVHYLLQQCSENCSSRQVYLYTVAEFPINMSDSLSKRYCRSFLRLHMNSSQEYNHTILIHICVLFIKLNVRA